MDRLSPRQRQCLSLSATLHDEEIAARLGISVHTVRSHIRDAKDRLGVYDRKAALRSLPTSDGGEFERVPVEAASEPASEASDVQSGDDMAEAGTIWPLPAPPESTLIRLMIMIGIGVVAAVLLSGLVAVISATTREVAVYAPEDGR